jgi:integrase
MGSLTTIPRKLTPFNAILESQCGRNSVVECQLPKLNVVGSSPIVRLLDKSTDSAPGQAFWGLLFLADHTTPGLERGKKGAIAGNYWGRIGVELPHQKPMPVQTPKSKASKGTVQIKNSNGRLQLVFSALGKRHYLSTGLGATPENQKVAQMRARQIELDILSGHFDHTLARYKPQASVAPDSPELPPIDSTPDLAQIWGRFLEFKESQCSPNTMKYTYGVYSNYVKSLPTHDLKEAVRIRDWCLKRLPLDACKRFITRLSACCDWGVESGEIDLNPFRGMAAKLKLPKSQTGEDDIDPFTVAERDAIIAAIASNVYSPKSSAYCHRHYAPLVGFLFATGCRPSEAVALQWKHVTADLGVISFEQALISTDGGRKIRAGLKTQERRRFPCNQSLKELLTSIRPSNPSPDSLLFPSPAGKPINIDNFRLRLWKPVLQGLGIKYRKPYQCRHTFITLALEAGLDAKDVARLVGNSPEVIYRHYAGGKRELIVPEF